jgi:hypothetical protein
VKARDPTPLRYEKEVRETNARRRRRHVPLCIALALGALPRAGASQQARATIPQEIDTLRVEVARLRRGGIPDARHVAADRGRAPVPDPGSVTASIRSALAPRGQRDLGAAARSAPPERNVHVRTSPYFLRQDP